MQLPHIVAPSPSNYIHTRSRSALKFGPWEKLKLHATTSISPIPKTVLSTLKDPQWHTAMIDEFQALLSNNTCDLVSPPSNANIVYGKWILQHKFKPDGSLKHYKARWVLHGFSQEVSIDFDETLSHVVKLATIRIVLSLALFSNWPVYQLDVKNAFLHDTLSRVLYYRQPTHFEDPSQPNAVCHLNRSLYGLKQAPRAWYKRFVSYASSPGFTSSKTDMSLSFYIVHTPSPSSCSMLMTLFSRHPPTLFSSASFAHCAQSLP